MFKKILIGIGTILIGILAVIFGRNSNGSGVRDSDGIIDNLGGSFKDLGDSNKRTRKRVTIIKRNNKTAQSGIKSAKDILKAAKRRSMDSGS